MSEPPSETTQIAELCPAAIELPGLHAPCPCAEFAAKFGTRPPGGSCPARETVDEMRRRHARELAPVHAATRQALHELSQAIRDAESRAAALEALGGRRRGGGG